MALYATTEVPEIKRLLSRAIAADPVANTVFSSIVLGLDEADAAGWAAHAADDPLVLAARSQQHTPVAVTAGWEDVSELAAAIAALDPPAAAVAAEPAAIDALVAGIGRATTSRMDERLFRLDALEPPRDVPGVARRFTPDDLDLLSAWYEAFAVEAFGRLPPGFGGREFLARAFRVSTCWLWTVDGVPVSFANRHRVVDGVSRIGPVYTPPGLRGRGYGSAATAAAARHILDEGAVPCLYTDLANPTSNKIYQALGFYPVLDRCLVRFD